MEQYLARYQEWLEFEELQPELREELEAIQNDDYEIDKTPRLWIPYRSQTL